MRRLQPEPRILFIHEWKNLEDFFPLKITYLFLRHFNAITNKMTGKLKTRLFEHFIAISSVIRFISRDFQRRSIDMASMKTNTTMNLLLIVFSSVQKVFCNQIVCLFIYDLVI